MQIHLAPGQFKLISLADEAIDAMEAKDWVRYMEDRENYALAEPHIKPGSRPTIYVLREVPNSLFLPFVLAKPTEPERQVAAFQAALVAVYDLRSADGGILDCPQLAKHDNGALRAEELERFDPQQLTEIGDAAFIRSFFRNRTERVYRLPPMWAALTTLQAARRAEPSQASQDQNKDAA